MTLQIEKKKHNTNSSSKNPQQLISHCGTTATGVSPSVCPLTPAEVGEGAGGGGGGGMGEKCWEQMAGSPLYLQLHGWLWTQLSLTLHGSVSVCAHVCRWFWEYVCVCVCLFHCAFVSLCCSVWSTCLLLEHIFADVLMSSHKTLRNPLGFTSPVHTERFFLSLSSHTRASCSFMIGLYLHLVGIYIIAARL